MTDIVDFLTVQLDEDEAAAERAARPEPWVKPQPPRPDWYVQFWADQQDRAAVIADPESSAFPIVTTLGYDGNDEAGEELAEGRVEHIARHDPARVLAEVRAKRRHLELWRDACDRRDRAIKLAAPAQPLMQKAAMSVRGEANGLCEAMGKVLLLDAAVYANRPGYKQEWSS